MICEGCDRITDAYSGQGYCPACQLEIDELMQEPAHELCAFGDAVVSIDEEGKPTIQAQSRYLH
jgi:hypothetical protein